MKFKLQGGGRSTDETTNPIGNSHVNNILIHLKQNNDGDYNHIRHIVSYFKQNLNNDTCYLPIDV